MPPHTGNLWETSLSDGTPVWLLEWEVRRRLPRRVLLAVDTSDSCAQERDSLKVFLRALADVLEVGDGCALWVIGRRDKAAEQLIASSDSRPELAQKLERALEPVRGGTWLRETFGAMLAEAEKTDPTSAAVFLLLATDGEVFDVEALPPRVSWPFGFLRLGARDSHQHEVLARRSKPLTSAAGVLKGFLLNPPAEITLEQAPHRSERLVAFSERGDIACELSPGGGVAVEDGQSFVRVAYVGGERPRPRLRHRAGGREWEVAEVACAALPAEPPAHLRRLLRALQGNKIEWDDSRLTSLAADREKREKLRCPKCARERMARQSLFCSCPPRALLVSRDGVGQDEVLELYEGTICFPLEGGAVHGPPVACRRATGDHAYDVQEDGDRSWLVLNLYK